MDWNNILDDLIGILIPDNVPPEYIIMARLIDHSGNEKILRGAELIKFMENPEKFSVKEARVILDVRKIKKTMTMEVAKFFENLESRLPPKD